MPHPRSSEILNATLSNNPLFLRDWETDIRAVTVEVCKKDEDPLGYRAIFFFSPDSERAQKKKTFTIGASYLAQRAANLLKAGYKAPMTQKAIKHIEEKIGGVLPLSDAEYLGRLAL
jgi:hypothetical protein